MSFKSKWKDRQRQIMDTVARRLSHILVPEIAAVVEEELDSDAFDGEGPIPQTIRIEDNQADTTVVSFSSGGFMHAGLPTYAFGDLLQSMQTPCNLIFVRDVHRVAYHLRPDAAPGGLEFYEAAINEAVKKMGSTTTLMVGDSSGAAAALYFGTRCGAKRVLALTMPYPMDPWSTPRALLRHLLNLRGLWRDRRAYWDCLMISGFSFMARRTLINHIGRDAIFDPIKTFKEATVRPRVTLVYGRDCLADATNAKKLEGIDKVELIPLPTGRHVLWIPLARHGSIGALIKDKLFGASPQDTEPQPGQ
jgi:hypothetical protein